MSKSALALSWGGKGLNESNSKAFSEDICIGYGLYLDVDGVIQAWYASYMEHPLMVAFPIPRCGCVRMHVIQIENEESGGWFEAFINIHTGEVVSATDFVSGHSPTMQQSSTSLNFTYTDNDSLAPTIAANPNAPRTNMFYIVNGVHASSICMVSSRHTWPYETDDWPKDWAMFADLRSGRYGTKLVMSILDREY
ncbi:hypothetical protein ARMGADRAFT_1037803 [Armillaria gallica]|uniref:Uncharacterized protein n=1 Tax=Armillaria gallica TaxID=47427 RepID=A0A2H3CYR4_ARMGA|nr:hypothetical protein ARMGADRAFT_1037803 [Armillaria gallica]